MGVRAGTSRIPRLKTIALEHVRRRGQQYCRRALLLRPQTLQKLSRGPTCVADTTIKWGNGAREASDTQRQERSGAPKNNPPLGPQCPKAPSGIFFVWFLLVFNMFFFVFGFLTFFCVFCFFFQGKQRGIPARTLENTNWQIRGTGRGRTDGASAMGG